MRRPSLLLMTAGAAALAVVANAATIASPGANQNANRSRLGNLIEQDLSSADAAAAQRKRALDMREQATKAAQARLQAELEARQKEAAAAAQTGTAAAEPADAQYDELAKIYQAMKPAKAAVVFEQLDMEVQMKVAQRMRERSTAMILAAMNPRAAAALSMALARRNARMANAGLRPPMGAAAPAPGAAPAAAPKPGARR